VLWKAQNQNRRSKKSSNAKSSQNSKTPPNTLKYNLSPLDRYYHVSSLNHLISKSSINFVHNLSPFGNEFIKHKLRKEQDVMHEIKIRVLHKAYKQVFKQLYTSLRQDL
jgi:hypothetical protein